MSIRLVLYLTGAGVGIGALLQAGAGYDPIVGTATTFLAAAVLLIGLSGVGLAHSWRST